MPEKITLLASLPTNDIENRLETLLKNCETVRGVVAFWTISTSFFSRHLLAALCRPNSFYCVDIHKPTSIDNLAGFVLRGAPIYLHAYELMNKVTGEKALPAGLLHSKIVLFDLPNDRAELWVGSHNLTKRAIKGENVEASLAIELNQQSLLYNQTKTYLEKIKEACEEFNMMECDYYKLLQGNPSEAVLGRLLRKGDRRILIKKALTIFGYDILNLHNQTIQLIGLGDHVLPNLGRTNTKLIIQFLDLETIQEITYIAEIQQAGIYDHNNPRLYSKIETSRRYALVSHQADPILEREGAIDDTLLRQSNYFIILKILNYRVEGIYELPGEDLWEPVSKESLGITLDESPNYFRDSFTKEKDRTFNKAGNIQQTKCFTSFLIEVYFNSI